MAVNAALHTPPPDRPPSHHHRPPDDDDTSVDADCDFSCAPQESAPPTAAPAESAGAPAAHPSHPQVAAHPLTRTPPNRAKPTAILQHDAIQNDETFSSDFRQRKQQPVAPNTQPLHPHH